MTKELPGGLLKSKSEELLDFVNAHIKANLTSDGYSTKGDCESQSFTLCSYLGGNGEPVFVAQIEGVHSVVYFDNEFWIDPYVGLIWNKARSDYIKLINFSQDYFEDYYGPKGLVKMTDNIIFLQIKLVARSLHDLEELQSSETNASFV